MAHDAGVEQRLVHRRWPAMALRQLNVKSIYDIREKKDDRKSVLAPCTLLLMAYPNRRSIPRVADRWQCGYYTLYFLILA
eukprot:scaffold17205_cov125-Isochrysis_galbana.AAC.3